MKAYGNGGGDCGGGTGRTRGKTNNQKTSKQFFLLSQGLLSIGVKSV